MKLSQLLAALLILGTGAFTFADTCQSSVVSTDLVSTCYTIPVGVHFGGCITNSFTKFSKISLNYPYSAIDTYKTTVLTESCALINRDFKKTRTLSANFTGMADVDQMECNDAKEDALYKLDKFVGTIEDKECPKPSDH